MRYWALAFASVAASTSHGGKKQEGTANNYSHMMYTYMISTVHNLVHVEHYQETNPPRPPSKAELLLASSYA